MTTWQILMSAAACIYSCRWNLKGNEKGTTELKASSPSYERRAPFMTLLNCEVMNSVFNLKKSQLQYILVGFIRAYFPVIIKRYLILWFGCIFMYANVCVCVCVCRQNYVSVNTIKHSVSHVIFVRANNGFKIISIFTTPVCHCCRVPL